MNSPLRAVIHSLLFSLAAISCCGTHAAAGDMAPMPVGIEVRAGVLAHDVSGLWSGFNREKGVDFNAELLLGPGLPFLGGIIRPAIGATINSSGYTSKGYADTRWEYYFPNGFFFGTGVGIAVHNGNLDPTDPNRKALGRRALFHIPIEFGYRLDNTRSVSLYFEHISNAYTAHWNEGLDSIGVRFGNRF